MKLSFPEFQRPSFKQIPKHALEKTNHLSQTGAAELARRLTDHWTALGYAKASFWHEPYNDREDGSIWVVRSNLINGIPPR